MKCPLCGGRGVIRYPYRSEELKKNPAVIAWVVSCACAKARDEHDDLERIWKGLSGEDPVETSPLQDLCREGPTPKDAVIEATQSDLRAHLGRVLRDHPDLRVQTRMVSDLDLVSAWLANADEIFDAEIASLRDHEDKYTRLVDIAGPSTLLILQLGVKASRNVATPEVIMEAIRCRSHRGKATWIVEDPAFPIQPGSISYSIQLESLLGEWPQIKLSGQPRIILPQLAAPTKPAVEKSSSERRPYPSRQEDSDPPVLDVGEALPGRLAFKTPKRPPQFKPKRAQGGPQGSKTTTGRTI